MKVRILALILAGCALLGSTAPSSKKLVVLFNDEPECLDWSVERMMSLMVGAAAVGSLGSPIIAGSMAGPVAMDAEHKLALKDGKLFSEGLPEYSAIKRSTEIILAQLQDKPSREMIVACSPAHGITENCSTFASWDELKTANPDGEVLVIRPMEYGLRGKIPYAMVQAVLYSIDKEKKVWGGNFSMKKDDVNLKKQPLEKWLEDKPALVAELDRQYKEIAVRIRQALDTGKYSASDNQVLTSRTKPIISKPSECLKPKEK